jgi:alkylation response protein AidB-like acyl-CoA dehydrogenase
MDSAIDADFYSLEHLLDDDGHQLLANVRDFMEKAVAPVINQYWTREEFPHDLVPGLAALGIAGLACTGYECPGGSSLLDGMVAMELARVDPSIATFMGVHGGLAMGSIYLCGSAEQKQRWLPAMARGEAIGALAMTEPGAGSDVQAIRTTALRQGEELVVNGSKTFITNGQLADLVLLACKTDARAGAKGVSLVLVEADRPGFKRGRNLRKLGQKAQDTSELFFEDMRLPISNVLGEEGRGFEYMMRELPQERLLIAITAIAMAEAALEWTLDYTRQRQAFGRPLAEFQTNRFKLAEMKTETQIGRVFLDRCLGLHLEGKLDVESAAMAKYWLTELEGRVIDQCLQMHGGYGYMLEYPIARAFADARVHRIYGGSNEIMRELVARHL